VEFSDGGKYIRGSMNSNESSFLKTSLPSYFAVSNYSREHLILRPLLVPFLALG